MSLVLDTTRFVVDRSKHVQLNQEQILRFAHVFKPGKPLSLLEVAPFDFSKFSLEEKLRFILIYNAVSFSFWGEPKWTIEYKNQSFDGAWGMIVALGRGVEEGFPLLNFKSVQDITREQFAQILKGNVQIPLFSERFYFLQEAGRVMAQEFDGRMDELVNRSQKNAQQLLDLMIQFFPSFHDVSFYSGKEICFYKRAQLFISDISRTLEAHGEEGFDLQALTACADYKLPQILRKLGILNYTGQLAQTVDSKIEILHGSEEEVEMRANTIWAVEDIKQEIKKMMPTIAAIDVSDYLWLATQQKSPDDKPYHRTRTTAY